MAAKKGTKRVVKVRPPINFAKVTATRVEGIEMARMRPTRGERDDEQKQVDKLVEAAWNEWRSAGSPVKWEDQPGTFLSVPQAQLETLQWRVRRAGTFMALKIRFGRIETVKGTDGVYSQVVFVATDRPAGEIPDTVDDEDLSDSEVEWLNVWSQTRFGADFESLDPAQRDAALEALEVAEATPGDGGPAQEPASQVLAEGK